jgi:phosphate-selective porin OprO and OprP
MLSTENQFKDLMEASMNTALKTTLLAALLGAVGNPNISRAEENAAGIPEGEQERMAGHDVDLPKMKFKPGKGLEVSSTDGQFKLTTRLRAQLRHTLEVKDSDVAQGLQLRRARLLFAGHVFGKHNAYKFELAVSPKDIGLRSDGTISKSPLLDWYFQFGQLRDLNVRAGQYKVPYSRQRVVSSGNLQMVDRSLANGEFTLDRDVGLDLRSKDLGGLGFLRYYAGVYTGEGHSSFSNADLGLMYLGRIEVLPLGMFKDYSEASFARPAKAFLSIGAGFAYVDEAKKNKGIVGRTPADGGTTDTVNFTGDVSFRLSGLSLEAAFFWRRGTRNAGDEIDDNGVAIPTEMARDGMGYYGQVGYLIPHHALEISARFGQVIAASESSLSDTSEAGLGFSYYFARHAMKLQGDYFRFWGDDGFSKGSDQVRVQMQLAY